MSNESKIENLGKEINIIDKVLYILLIFIIIQISLTIFGAINLNLMSILTVGFTLIMFRINVKKRNLKETQMKMYEAMVDPDAFDEKYRSE